MQTALITGASAGIGREYAIELGLTHQYNLVLVARRKERLESLKEEIQREARLQNAQVPTVTIIDADLRKETERSRVITLLQASSIEIDLLVNNAGYGSLGGFAKSNLDWEINMVELNCIAPLHFCRHFLPRMQERKKGAIINVCSTISFQPFPYMATYGATKAFLLSLSLALAAEGRRYNVFVLAHCPGPTESEFHTVAGLGEKLSYLPGMTAKDAVTEALRALKRNKRLIINGRLNRFLAKVSYFLTPSIASRVVGFVMKKHE